MRCFVDLEHVVVAVLRRDDRDLQVRLKATARVEHVFACIVCLPDKRLDPMRFADVAAGDVHADSLACVPDAARRVY